MAITRAQQFKQMLAQGGRIGLQGGGRDSGRDRGPETGREPGPVGGGKGIGGNGGNTNRERGIMRSIPQAVTDIQRGTLSDPREKQDVFERPSKLSFLDFIPGIGTVRRIARTFGPLDNKKFFEDKVVPSLLDRGMKVPTFENYMKARMSNQTDAYGNPIDQDDDDNNIMLPQTMFARQTPSITKEEEEKDNFNFRLLAEGGRAGFQEGGGIEQRLEQLGGDVTSAEQVLQAINKRLETAESSLGSGGGIGGLPRPANPFRDPVTGGGQPANFFNADLPDKLIPIDPYKNTLLSGLSQDGQRFDSAQSAFDALAEQTRKTRETHRGRDVIGTELFQGAEGFKNFTDMFNKINDPSYVAPSPQLLSAQGSLGIPAAGYANGGNVVGGEFDFESARQMYGLGKLVKKVTRTVKKIAKSPIGKAAILGAGTYFGLGKFGATKDLGMLAKLGIAGAVAGLPFLAQQEEEEEPLYAGADIADPRFIMANPQRFQNIRLMAEGGSTEKEPVAKKTMPLLDMGGQEMDLRAEGGFVPIGRMEKADDVPARLSKNEFVFTADAVRNAGDGNVDKGAEVMYNMMKNLEAGGEVSEESQGLEGARRMFQTSQRLEEVL